MWCVCRVMIAWKGKGKGNLVYLPPMIQNPVAPHCQGAMRKVVPAGSEQTLLILFEFLVVTSGAQLPFL